MEYTKKHDLPGILLNIDFEKAFDSLDHGFIFSVLKKFNFGKSMIRWIQTFYSDISSCVSNNGITTAYFPVERGVRQGDPLSPYLFVLCVEILATQIRNDKNIKGLLVAEKETKLVQYADDTSGLLDGVNSAKNFIEKVVSFGSFSGLNLNKSKTEAMWLGKNRLNQSKPLDISWPEEPLRILGVYVSYDEKACNLMNFERKIEKVKGIMNMWTGRNLTMYGKAQIAKTFIMSQFLFVSSAISMPKHIVKEINNLVFKFVWNGKKERIKRSVLMNEIPLGGLRIPDMHSMIEASKLVWIKRLTKTNESP